MKLAVGSDEATHLTTAVIEDLRQRGHEVELFGALGDSPSQWARVGVEVGRAVASGRCDQGVLFCWTGTGISLAANKVPGIRAALCADAETARGARKWNDANILAISLRAVSEVVAKEMLEAWFSATVSTDAEDLESLTYLEQVEAGAS